MRNHPPTMPVRQRGAAAAVCTLVAAVVAVTVPIASVAPSGAGAGESDPVMARVLRHYAAETAGIDATLPGLGDPRQADAIVAAHERGVPVRAIVPAALYRDPAHAWHAWNLDRLHAAGVPVRHLRQGGSSHDALVVLHGQGMVMQGAFGGTTPGAATPAAFAQFATRASTYAWAVERFTRLWHNGAGHEETVEFMPLPPGPPRLLAPADGADGQPPAVVARWQPGPWAHLYDLYLGTTPGRLIPVAPAVAISPGRAPGEAVSVALPDLAADTTYYWRVVSRTLAGMQAAGPVWSFRTGSAVAAATSPERTAVSRSATATLEASLADAIDPAVLDMLVRRRPPQGVETGRLAVPRTGDDADGQSLPAPPPAVAPSPGAPPVGPAPPGNPPPAAPSDPDSGGAPGDDAAPGAEAAPHPPAVDGYPGREPDAAWRQEALARIERIRKSDIELRIVDAEGQPIEGAEVRLEMTRHQFGFGSAVSAFYLTTDSSDGRRYATHVEHAFNRVVFENDLKWHNWVRSGHAFYNRENTFNALAWLAQRGISVRGHYGVWGKRSEDVRLERLGQMSPADFGASLIRDAIDQVTAIGTQVREWDVVNHPNGRSEGTLLEVLGPDYYDRVFHAVAEAQPDALRYINEGDVLSTTRINRDRYRTLIAEMLRRGAPVQGVGLMGHFFSDDELVSPEELLDVFDSYAELGLPLLVTEFDHWSSDEVLQADFMRDFLIAAFSHPAVEGIVMWGFWEGRHWHPPAALYRRDWSVKPNGRAWEQLVLHDWWTDTTGVTGEDGVYAARGFHGTYEVDVHAGHTTVTCTLDLGPDGVTGEVRLDSGTCRIDAGARDESSVHSSRP